jgi:hypothetical protein
LTNVPLDTAVQLLADMAELKVVHRDNVLYVTTPEHAAKLEKDYGRGRPRVELPSWLGGLVDDEVFGSKWRKGSGQPVILREDLQEFPGLNGTKRSDRAPGMPGAR